MSHVVIVGATTGTGRALAESLIQDGFDVTITGRDERRSAMVAEELKRRSSTREVSIHSLAVDLSDPQSLSDAFKTVETVDHLVLCGMTRDQNTIKAFNVPAAVELVTTKLVGYAAAAETLRSRMVAGSSVVMFGGIAKDAPYPGSTMVTTVNNGIVGLVKTLSIELSPIRVNAIHPGLIADSPYWVHNESVLADGERRVLADGLPTMRDIVDGCRFLMRNGAANGVNLGLDGGMRS